MPTRRTPLLRNLLGAIAARCSPLETNIPWDLFVFIGTPPIHRCSDHTPEEEDNQAPPVNPAPPPLTVADANASTILLLASP